MDGRNAPAWILGSPQFAALLLRPWMTKVERPLAQTWKGWRPSFH